MPAALASLIVLAGFAVGCKKPAPKSISIAAVPVTVAVATTQDVPIRLQAIGAVQSISNVSIRALVSGELKSVNFHQGDEVRKGQVLFTIDPRPYQATLAQAEANLAKDMSNFAQAQAQAKRYADLAKAGVVSSQQNEQVQVVADAGEAVVRADRAAVDTARLNLSYCTITAPTSGRTGSLLVQAGNLVQPNTTILVTINQIAPIYVSFSVPEQNLAQVKGINSQRSPTVTATAQNETQSEKGTLSFINNAIDNNTGTIQLMATFPNTSERLWPGEYVNTEVTLGVINNATVVPATAILTGQSGMYVYAVQPNNTVKNQPVTTGITAGGLTVVTSGLAPGQKVVTDGQLALAPGSRVNVRPAPAPRLEAKTSGSPK